MNRRDFFASLFAVLPATAFALAGREEDVPLYEMRLRPYSDFSIVGYVRYACVFWVIDDHLGRQELYINDGTVRRVSDGRVVYYARLQGAPPGKPPVFIQ